MSKSHYLITGILYILGAIPGAVFLTQGHLMGNTNPYLLLSVSGAVPGCFLLVYGAGVVPPGSRSGIGLRIAFIGVSFALFMVLSLAGVAAGIEPLETSVVFCSTAASYLALVSLVFLILGLGQKKGVRNEP